MDSSNSVNYSKASAFNKFKRLYYPRFFKIRRFGECLNQFLVVLYDCVPSMSQFLSVDKLLLNDSVSQLGIVRNPTTPLCSDTTKREDFLTKKGP